MFQILFGIGTDTVNATWLNKALRELFGVLDLVVYTLISFIYQVLFTIADSEILSSDYMREFYGRFQVILGIFMIFKLAISVLQYVVNPDLMSDKKQGLGNVITRIITMLAMLIAIMPLTIPSVEAQAGSYNDYLNKHGLLFGTMYSLQSRILNGGVLEKLILGDSTTLTTGVSDSTLGNNPNSTTGNSLDIEKSANRLSIYILKTFIRPNLKDTAQGEDNPANFYCCKDSSGNTSGCEKADNGRTNWYTEYNDENIDPATLIELLHVTCDDGRVDPDDGNFALAYFPIVPTICGLLILWVLINFCIEIAKRALRLAILRLIAPIPIISYVDPKSSEKGSFATWTKELITAFLQLFLALAIIFFSINIVAHIMDTDTEFIVLPVSDGFSLVNSVATILIIIAVFLFAKEAPRFIMNALGIKGTGYGLGFAGALGGLGAMMGGAGVQGLLSGAANAMQDTSDAYVQGKAAPPSFGSQRDKVTQMLTGDKNARGGLFGRFQRAANDRANNHMARHFLGLDRNISGQAKDEMYRLKGIASGAEERYKRFSQGNMSADELSRVRASDDFYNNFDSSSAFADYRDAYIAAHGGGSSGARAFNSYWESLGEAGQRHQMDTIYGGLSADEQRNAMAQTLEADWGSKQTAANKQEAWYNDSSKLLEGFGINETLQEKYSRRGEGAYRANRMYRNGPGYTAPERGHRGYARSHQYRSNADMRRTQRNRRNPNDGSQSRV